MAFPYLLVISFVLGVGLCCKKDESVRCAPCNAAVAEKETKPQRPWYGLPQGVVVACDLRNNQQHCIGSDHKLYDCVGTDISVVCRPLEAK